jgi:hypothetical protein
VSACVSPMLYPPTLGLGLTSAHYAGVITLMSFAVSSGSASGCERQVMSANFNCVEVRRRTCGTRT